MKKSSSYGSRNSSSSSEEEEAEEESSAKSEDEDEEGKEKGGEGEEERERELASFEESQGLVLRRFQLERWAHEPYFETLVLSLLTRVVINQHKGSDASLSLAPKYRLVRIEGVETGAKVYSFSGKPTRKRLRVSVGGSTKSFSMSLVSNQKCTRDDFDEYNRQREKAHLPPVTKEDVLTWRQRLQIPVTYVYQEEDIRRMVEEKEKLRKLPTNIAIALQKLIEKRDVREGRREYVSVCVCLCMCVCGELRLGEDSS